MTDDAWLHLADARIVLVVLANRGAGRRRRWRKRQSPRGFCHCWALKFRAL